MKRRTFIAGLGGAAAWPLAARAQQGDRVRRIGVLSAQAMDSPTETVWLDTLRQGLARLGWVEGRNLQIDVRYSEGRLGRAQAIAKELVALRPDVILGESTPYVRLLKQGTGSIPIVFISVSDPVGSGFVESLARPGGNLTGFLLFEGSITGKWLGMLKEIAPQLKRAAFIANPTAYDYLFPAAKQAASALGIDLTPYPVENREEVERTIDAIAREPNSGLLFPPDNTMFVYWDLVLILAAKYRLPAVFSEREMVEAGGLMAYYTDRRDQYRLAAGYVDRILRGAKPADLPVQTPVKYVTILNLRTAKALGLNVPPTLLVRADEVIEYTPYGRLGVRFRQITQDMVANLHLQATPGAIVIDVDETGAAKAAGIQAGDVIIRIGGKEILELRDLPRIVAETPANKAVEVVIIRAGAERGINVTLGPKIPPRAQ